MGVYHSRGHVHIAIWLPTMRRLRRGLPILCAILSFGAVGEAARADTPVILLGHCPGEYAARPTSWQTGCGLCNTFYSRANWTSWGGRKARGTVTVAMVRTRGTESCAAGYKRARKRAKRVRIILAGKRECDGRTIYSRITLRRRGRTILHDRFSQRCYEG